MTLFTTLILAAMFGPAGFVHTDADIAWVAEGPFCEPETVLPLPDDTLLVSNVCGFAEKGSGFVSKLSPDGEILEARFIPGLDAPLGMALHKSNLYVIDSNRVKIFDTAEFILWETIELETSVANDIAVGEHGDIYVTDSAGHKVLHRSTDGQQAVLSEGFEFRGANGIEVKGTDLYVGGARLWKVDLESRAVETLGPEWLVDIDGIEFEVDGTLQLTLVAGPLVRYRDDNSFQILSGEGISSANHGYSASLGLALVPTGYDNTVIAIRVPDFPLKP